jgi:hypothetical protein
MASIRRGAGEAVSFAKAGHIESSNGSANATPAPYRNLRRLIDGREIGETIGFELFMAV